MGLADGDVDLHRRKELLLIERRRVRSGCAGGCAGGAQLGAQVGAKVGACGVWFCWCVWRCWRS